MSPTAEGSPRRGVALAVRWIRRGLAALLAAAVLGPLLYAAAVPEPRATVRPLAAAPEARYAVWVVDWGYHSAVAFEQAEGWRLGPPGQEAARYVEAAWGDRAFYHGSDFRPHALAATLVLPTASVAYLRGRASPPDPRSADAVWRREVGADTLRALAEAVEASIARGARGGRARPLASAEGYSGRFFPARGPYLWTRSCNWWTVARLADAGLADAPFGVVVTPQIGGRLRGFRRVAGR